MKHCTHPFFLHLFLFFSLSFLHSAANATIITGSVLDAASQPLPFSSIYLKGSSRGTTANSEGRFVLDLQPGTYTLYCTHVGFEKVEKEIKVTAKEQDLFFRLYPIKTEMKDVVVKANAEDPAYAIIRSAIASRNAHLIEVKTWQVQVYIKGLIKTLQVPKKVFGVKVKTDRNIIDSSGKGIIYLSESLTKYSRKLPNQYKEEIISAKVSGRSNGFGFNSPKTMELNLYQNNIALQGLNERGFVSPIANNAFNYYQYKYEGSFYEDGVEINKIRIIPKRPYEPCFAGGYINIIEGSWYIHGVDLYLTKASQIELVDSLYLQQQMIPVDKKYWLPQQTSFFANIGTLGFKASASFAAVYTDYNLNPNLSRSFFGNVVRTADTSANKKSTAYWQSIRPVPLTEEETTDYEKKDALELKNKDPKYLDSIDRINNRPSFTRWFVYGYSPVRRSTKMRYTFEPLTRTFSYNTVEGAAVNLTVAIRHNADTGAYTITPLLRYGFGNQRLQASLAITKTIGNNYKKRWNLTMAGGQNLFQINADNPQTPFSGTVGALIYKENYIKFYEKKYLQWGASKNLADGLRASISFNYEKRHLPDNTDTTYSWIKYKNQHYEDNYPAEIPDKMLFADHQVFLSTIQLTYQPGQKFIEYPTRRFSIGSSLPVFVLSYTHGFDGLFGSTANFDKWRLTITDDVNLKLAGAIGYKIEVGGFLNTKKVYLPDYHQYIGNRSTFAGTYLTTFQLTPYYEASNIQHIFYAAHVEHHFNGLLTNKIPFIKKLNLGLVTGINALYISKTRNYTELFVSIENILKILRVDFVWGYKANVSRPQAVVQLGFTLFKNGN